MIFYFSATGNSKYTAIKIQDTYGGELIKIDDALRCKKFKYTVGDGEKVFFVFPVYFYSMPTLVEDFVSQIQLAKKTNKKEAISSETCVEDIDICAIITCGKSIGGADKLFRKAFKEKKIPVRAVYQLQMVENYILLFKAPLKEEQIMSIRRADGIIDEIIEHINFNFRVSYESGPMAFFLSKIANKIYKATNKTEKFYADDKCIGCGLCEKICPVAAIEMKNGKPQWTCEMCSHCLACIHRCPVEAIQYGKSTEKKGRYVNPILK